MDEPKCDWYTQNIEEGIREVVKLLRNNGINTTCSCHHSMTIWAEGYRPGDIEQIDSVLLQHGYSYYKIEMIWTRRHDSIHGALVKKLKITFLKCPECGENHIVNISGLVAHRVLKAWPDIVTGLIEEIRETEDTQKRKESVRVLLDWMRIFASNVEKPEITIPIWSN
jgi:hypothetical protein